MRGKRTSTKLQQQMTQEVKAPHLHLHTYVSSDFTFPRGCNKQQPPEEITENLTLE